MKLCIITESLEMLGKGFKISKLGEFRGAEIYELEMFLSAGKRRVLRLIKKCIRELEALGITFGAVNSGFEYIREFNRWGISFVTEKEIFLKLRADAGIAFSEKYCPDADFLLVGGSRAGVLDAAKQILKKRRRIFLQCADYENICEAILEETGVRVQSEYSGDVVRIDMSDAETFLKYSDIEAGISDFQLYFCGDCFREKENKCSAELASVLEICGFLQKKEIKTVCSMK